MKAISFVLSCIVILFFLSPKPVFGQQKIRIGTYDSRAVAVAWFNSSDGKQVMELIGGLQKKNQEALDAKDTVKSKKLIREGQMRQAMLHEQAFGTGSVRYFLEPLKDKLALLAKNENLDLIVSKYELNYSSPNTLVIDITEKVTDLLSPDKRFKTMLPELIKNEPVKDAYLIED